MHFPTLVQAAGSTGFFANRAFLPAFLFAVMLAYGPEVSFIANLGLFEAIHDVPPWFTHRTTLIVLAVLAVLESTADKIPEARDLLRGTDTVLKMGMGVVTYTGLATATDQMLFDAFMQQAGLAETAAVGLVALGIYYGASRRNRILAALSEGDMDDATGLQGFFSWMEDLWVLVGVPLLILFPIFVLLLLAISWGVIILVARRVHQHEEQKRIPCDTCGTLIYPCATTCPACDAPVPAPVTIGVFGQSKAQPARDREQHRLRLIEKGRCPECAARFSGRSPRPTCGTCGHTALADAADVDRYVQHVSRRVPVVCGVGLMLSLVPAFGLVAGIIYYRVTLVSPYRRY
ncbi:MAG: DUF4126 family protein, partial [Bacteroidetes bacterium]|nr:DUF4126 family protein [Bacteroidota bacterium]